MWYSNSHPGDPCDDKVFLWYILIISLVELFGPIVSILNFRSTLCWETVSNHYRTIEKANVRFQMIVGFLYLVILILFLYDICKYKNKGIQKIISSFRKSSKSELSTKLATT